MPNIRVITGENGRVLPAGPLINTPPGSRLDFKAYPNPGYRLKSFFLDGIDKGRANSLAFDSVAQDRVVEAQFCKTFLNRTSKYTLENKAGGIQVKFCLERNMESTVGSTVKVTLYNASNSLTAQWDTEGACELGFTTLGVITATKDFGRTTAEMPAGTSRAEVTMQVKGVDVSLYISTQDGKQPATLFGRLFEGTGSQNTEGWVISVDGLTTASTGEYSLDVSDFNVMADAKKPLVDSMSFRRASTKNTGATANSLEM